MLQRPCRSLANDRSQAGGPTLGNENAVHTGRLRGPDDSPEVVRVFHAVQQHDKGGLRLVARQLENLLCAAVGLGGDERDHALMSAAGCQPV